MQLFSLLEYLWYNCIQYFNNTMPVVKIFLLICSKWCCLRWNFSNPSSWECLKFFSFLSILIFVIILVLITNYMSYFLSELVNLIFFIIWIQLSVQPYKLLCIMNQVLFKGFIKFVPRMNYLINFNQYVIRNLLLASINVICYWKGAKYLAHYHSQQ